MTKKIYFEPAAKIHSSQWHLINYPPEGYEFITDKVSDIGRVVNSDFFYYKTRRIWENLLATNLTKARLEGYFKKIPENIDIIYAYNHPVFRKIPWVVFVEWAHCLVGRNIKYFKRHKALIEKLLSSEYCRGIHTVTEWGKKSILLNYDCAGFAHKIKVIPNAACKKNFIKNYDDSKIKLLYVGSGSANVYTSFDIKGGKEVLEVFSILNQKYKTLNIELVVRAIIPNHIKVKYRKILAMQNVRVIEDVLPWESLENEFINADIFIYPSHMYLNNVILDAMSYELPIITTETGSACMLNDGVTCFIVKNLEKFPYFWSNKVLDFIPSAVTPKRKEFLKTIQSVDPEVITELTEKTSILIENSELRRKMGKAARWEVEEGKFSIKNRNEKLKRIFDEATSSK